MANTTAPINELDFRLANLADIGVRYQQALTAFNSARETFRNLQSEGLGEESELFKAAQYKVYTYRHSLKCWAEALGALAADFAQNH